ncbi:MAG: cysteine desulfurase [Alphaproteobacteria bacterium]|nr:cysteine desulfurase [Alphaproteobacteria bacterium]
MNDAIYLDYNATAPLRPEALDAMTDAMGSVGNPSSVHGFGRAAHASLERARASVAALVDRPPAGVVFTAGGTEADALALRGTGRGRVLVSRIEHDAVLAAAPGADRITVDAEGRLDLDHLDTLLGETDEPALVSVMWANNETGVIQPIARVVERAHAAGALVHVDAVPGAGRLDPSVLSKVDLITLSAHKLGGPAGVGALVVREGVPLVPLIAGGGQEKGRRSGTENRIGIAGFAAVAVAAMIGRETEQERLARLRDGMEARLRAGAPELRVLGAGAPRLANTSCLGLPGVPAETQVMTLDLDGIAVSAGSACSSGKVKRSHVLDAMLPGDPIAGHAIRVSLGWATTEADIDRFAVAWQRMRQRLSPAARAA